MSVPAAVPRYCGRRTPRLTGPSALLLRLLERRDRDRSEAHLARLLGETERNYPVAEVFMGGPGYVLCVTWTDRAVVDAVPAAPLCRYGVMR